MMRLNADPLGSMASMNSTKDTRIPSSLVFSGDRSLS